MRVEFVEKMIAVLAHEQQYLQANPHKQAWLARLASDWQEMIAQVSEHDCLGLADFLVFYVELQEQWLADKDKLDTADVDFILSGLTPLQALLQTGDIAVIPQVIALLENPLWIHPIAAEDLSFLQDLLVTDCQHFRVSAFEQEQELTESNTELVGLETDDDGGFCRLDDTLLSGGKVTIDAALATMIGEQCVLLHQQWQTPTHLPELLAQTLEALPPIAKASETIQLWGGKLIVSGLMKNLQCYQDDVELLSEATPVLIEQALAAISGFFQDISAPDKQSLVISVFENPEWPYCLDEEQGRFLLALFALAVFETQQAMVAEIVADQDSSLDIPDDVDAQLLDMIFNDLPTLTEEFAKVLHQFLKAKDREALRTAQRVAHTVKGLANMLGVKGLANLTHRLEDILELLYQRGQTPDALLAEALIEATDCLEAMCEALLVRKTAPSQSLAVLQQLADAHYQLKTGKHSGTLPIPETTALTETSDVEQDIDTSNREDSYIRVPKPLLDNLFRIAGEVKILDAQLDEQLKQIKALLKTGGERYRALQRVLGDFEQMMSTSLINTGTAHESFDSRFDHLEMNRFNEMHSSISRLYEAAADSREIEATVETYSRQMHRTVAGLTHLHQENLENVIDTRLVSVQSLISRLQRTLRQASRVTGKQVELTVVGETMLIDSQILNQLADPLMHIIRNAVDHGLEATEHRLQVGKPENGQITISFAKETDRIVVSCRDDGQGIKRRAIKQMAISKGLILANAELSDQDIDRLILIPGFSTSTTVSQLSGRGIGMDVVYQEIIRLKGKLEIHSTPGQGCQFTLSIPSSSLLLKASLAQCGDYKLSIIQYGIDQTLSSKEGSFEKIGEDLWFSCQNERLQAYSIESLIGLVSPNYRMKEDFHLLVVNLGQGEKAAVMVEHLFDSRELVFKDMGRYIPHNAAIPGVTILPDGKVSPVLDLPEALKHKSTYNQRVMDFVAQTVVKKLPKILVVDDSLSARKSLATLLKDSGYDVATAIDGQDALKQIAVSQPDLVITDMEMPRMNGVELTATLKQQRRTGMIPVIMITSRSTDKHRMEAGIVGVNAYLTKPWSETDLLQQVEALL